MTGGGVVWSTGVETAPVYAAAGCVAMAAWLVGGRGDALRRGRLLFVHGAATPWSPGDAPFRTAWDALRRWLGQRMGREWWCLAAGAVCGLWAESPWPTVVAALAVPVVGRLLRRRARQRRAECREAAVIEWCVTVAGELRAGLPPERALVTAGTGGLEEAGPAVLAAARFGGDVPAALRQAAQGPGAGGLRAAADCWQLARDGGTGLAAGLDRVALALGAERDQREELRAQLAGPRATASMLAVLPLCGLALGSAMGADPWEVLLHTPAGWGCLVLGALLEWAGLAWVARLVRGGERPVEASRG